MRENGKEQRAFVLEDKDCLCIERRQKGPHRKIVVY